MKKLLLLIIAVVSGLGLWGQTKNQFMEGKVSYVTAQSVYVKFNSTEHINPGDTLYISKDGNLIPALIVKNLSSISCVCTPITEHEFKISDVVVALIKSPVVEEPSEVVPSGLVVIPETIVDSTEQTEEEEGYQQDIRGRFTVASYSNFSNTDVPMNQRMRYVFSFQGNHLGDSKVSVESYLSFTHSNKNWDDVRQDIFNGLKIYNLAVKYDFNKTTRAIIGRKINPRISNVGAIDGVQFEKQFNAFTAGAIAGARPDYMNYSLNFNLPQFGIYFGHDLAGKKGRMQSTVSFIEQQNKGKTDRRYMYFQHINSLVKNVYFFGSIEMDLYKKVNDKAENTFDLANIYVSLRYRPIRQLSLSASYSARNNIIYFESYEKSFIDRLLETEALQGWRMQVNVRPVKNLNIGLNGGYRFRKQDPAPSRNLYSYVTYSRVPGINASVTLSATILETSYLNGEIYSLGLSRDLIPGKLYGDVSYRMVNYHYYTGELQFDQDIANVGITWRMLKKLSLSVNYEGTFEKPYTYTRLYANAGWRF